MTNPMTPANTEASNTPSFTWAMMAYLEPPYISTHGFSVRSKRRGRLSRMLEIAVAVANRKSRFELAAAGAVAMPYCLLSVGQ